MVVSFSLEPATAPSIPSKDDIWLSLSHKSSKLKKKSSGQLNNATKKKTRDD